MKRVREPKTEKKKGDAPLVAKPKPQKSKPTVVVTPIIQVPPLPVVIPSWINEQNSGVPKVYLERVFRHMREKGYTATGDLKDCTCMNADLGLCYLDYMTEQQVLCQNCARRCSDCGEANLEFFKSKTNKPICNTCACYMYGDKRTWWEEADWERFEREQKEEENSD